MEFDKVKIGYLLTVLLSILLCALATEIETENGILTATQENKNAGMPIQENDLSIEDVNSDEIDYEVRNGTYGYQRHPSKFAAVIIYCMVALAAVFAILIKYFITQYETQQAKAQLEYQQLQAMKP